ncbi:unnamed protein product [Prorocentrum cordatum]|uniref:Uncharacterized protein n=1 Tax=Prorocentrum cordatum TaxID=2364126 RepID=A0ABN9XWW0_9DINO|nr:unnamed protein product [Polarella glacialis]
MARHEAARPGEDGELGGAAADGALAVSPEELQLLAEIRAMEIDMSLMDLRGQLEAQEAFLEQWQKDLEKEKGAPREARASLESAQRQVADLRRHIGQLEEINVKYSMRENLMDSRPPRPNPAPPTEEDTQAPAPRACDGATERAEMTAPLARPLAKPPAAPAPPKLPEQTARRAVARASPSPGPEASPTAAAVPVRRSSSKGAVARTVSGQRAPSPGAGIGYPRRGDAQLPPAVARSPARRGSGPPSR